MRLFLIRHGQSRANVDAVIQGDDDPLTDFGRAQAHAAGKHLGEQGGITHLYASPMARARETAEIIGSYIGLEPSLEAGLAEINPGTAAGLTWDEWTAANPEIAERLRSNKRTLEDRWEGGESGREFVDRIFTAYDRIVTQHLGTDDVVAVVSHGGPLSWISARLHGDSLEYWPFDRSDFRNCSVTEIEIDAGGVHTVCALNQVTHLAQLEQE
jgi:probable phosphoglycerate mutase